MISGPATGTVTVAETLNGQIIKDGSGIDVAEAGRCLTDTFSITNQRSVPTICGTNTDAHGKMHLYGL